VNELVVGFDGSDQSRSALRWAAALAVAGAVDLVVAEAWTGGERVASEEIGDRVTSDLADVSAEVLAGTAPGVRVEFEALFGSPAAALLHRATPDSGLVLGSRGRGGFAGLLLGSVSRACIEHAPCPVVILRGDHPAPSAGTAILVGHDGSPSADRALQWAAELAGLTGAEVVVAYIWRASASEMRPRLHGRLTADAAQSVRRWAEDVGPQVRPMEVEGEARMELVKLAERLDAGLLVVGRRGAGDLRALRLGSVASYLVTSSPVPLAVVPPVPELSEA
jgi:nucleotide-binding universal stress UspA family protein